MYNAHGSPGAEDEVNSHGRGRWTVEAGCIGCGGQPRQATLTPCTRPWSPASSRRTLTRRCRREARRDELRAVAPDGV